MSYIAHYDHHYPSGGTDPEGPAKRLRVEGSDVLNPLVWIGDDLVPGRELRGFRGVYDDETGEQVVTADWQLVGSTG